MNGVGGGGGSENGNGSVNGMGGGADTPPNGSISKRRKKPREVNRHRKASAAKPILIRINRPGGAFHIVTLNPQVTVANLIPVLNEKLLQGKGVETHRLYLKERGRGMAYNWFCLVCVVD